MTRLEPGTRSMRPRTPGLTKPDDDRVGAAAVAGGTRLLGPDDAGELLTLQLAAWVKEAHENHSLAIPPLLEGLPDVRAQLHDRALTIWGFRERGRLIATVRTTRLAADRVFLARLGVVPDRMGKGYGAAMLRHAEAQLPDGIRRIELVTGIRSVANHGFYTHAGYRIVEHDYRVGIVHMAKDLPAPSS